MRRKKVEFIFLFLFIFSIVLCAGSLFSHAKMPEIEIDSWVSISGEIDKAKADEVILALMNLDSKPGSAPIGIRISSAGGSLTAVMAICDVIKALRHPVVTLALGEATSGAAIILSCGDKRYLGEHTIVMLHQPTVVFEGWSFNLEELQEFSLALKKIENQMYHLLAKNTGKTEEEIKQALKKELWLTAREAIEFGLADEVLKKGELGIKVREEDSSLKEEKEEKKKEKPDANFPSPPPCQNLN